MFSRSSFSSSSFNPKSWAGLNQAQLIASLGAAPYKKAKPTIDEEEIEEALSAATVSRIQTEFLSEQLAQDLINRARKRKERAEEEALLLIL